MKNRNLKQCNGRMNRTHVCNGEAVADISTKAAIKNAVKSEDLAKQHLKTCMPEQNRQTWPHNAPYLTLSTTMKPDNHYTILERKFTSYEDFNHTIRYLPSKTS